MNMTGIYTLLGECVRFKHTADVLCVQSKKVGSFSESVKQELKLCSSKHLVGTEYLVGAII